eukprot:357507-Pelagomonas_calceolata.AAC.1
MIGLIQVHVFRHCVRRVDGLCISGRKCAPLMICQPFTVVYSGTRGCELIPVAKVSGSQVHHKLTEVYRCDVQQEVLFISMARLVK